MVLMVAVPSLRRDHLDIESDAVVFLSAQRDLSGIPIQYDCK
jgi:predicted O-linked N-acetylglucosamine transferase (SPINDLY family)